MRRGELLHVLPKDDLVAHDGNDHECVCGPEIAPVPRDDGKVDWVVVHHALDGRE